MRGQSHKAAPFNSKIKRADHDRLEQKFNPGPGTYQNVRKCAAFKNDFITKQDFQARQIFSQGGGGRSTKTAAGPSYNRMNAKEMEAALSQGMDVSYDVYGNPSYTVKEGGTLKKKLQPYAASKTGRDGLNIAKERLQQVTAPGSYQVVDGFGPTKEEVGSPSKKSANERLAAMGLLKEIFNSAGTESQKQLQLEVMQGRDTNTRSAQRKGNYYAAQGAEDYLISENQDGAPGEEIAARGASRRSEVVPGALMRPVNADMMKRVRNTAKWSQLYKSGPSFPPKHKVLFINQDEEDGNMSPRQGTEEDTKDLINNDISKNLDHQGKQNAGEEMPSPQQLNEILSSGTHKHHNQSDFDDMGKIFPGGENMGLVQDNFGMPPGRHQGQLPATVDQMSNIKVFQKMKSDETQYRMPGAEGGPGVGTAQGGTVAASKQSSQSPHRRQSSSHMKRQKSIKLNLTDAAANAKSNIGMRKSSEIIQDTFRGGESQERIIQQAATGQVQGLPPHVAADQRAAGGLGTASDGASGSVKRGAGSPGEASVSMGTAERNRQEQHLLGAQFGGELNAIQAAY